MRRTTIAAGAAAALIAGAALAVPALAADPGSTTAPNSASSSAPSGLTDAQKAELDDFLAAHPRMAQQLVNRIEGWTTFADAHPGVVAELKKVAALPQDQRRAELEAWAKAHPDDATALREFRQQVRADRKERRHDRRDQRQERRGTTAPTASPTSTVTS